MKKMNTKNNRTACVAALALSLLNPAYAEPAKPNIILIYTDDQGVGDVGALNPEAKLKTPNMDKVATEGVIYTDGHSSDAVCTPSRYSLLTGRYAFRTKLKKGVVKADGPCLIKNGQMTLASLLKGQGYRTAMVGKWHLNMEFPGEMGNRDWSQPITDGPIEKGFDTFFGIAASMNFGVLTFIENDHVLEAPNLWYEQKTIPEKHTYRIMPPYAAESQGKRAVEVAPSFKDERVLEKLTEKAVEFINQSASAAKKGKPFFLYFPMTSPHLPVCPHPDFQGTSACGSYGDFVQETDHRVGQVLNALKQNGIDENTLVIFSSDNGGLKHRELQKEYGHYSNLAYNGAKKSIYEGGHRVPFLMRWPARIKPGKVVDVPVCQTDFLATFAELLDVKLAADQGVDSYSLLDTMTKDDYSKDFRGPIIFRSYAGYFAIRNGKWKLNLVRGSASQEKHLQHAKPGEPPYELYDLEADPRETTNLYEKHPEVAEMLTAKISDIIRKGRTTPGATQDFVKEDWKQLTWMDLK